MFGYSMTELIFFFLIYCFVGWVIESSYVSIKDRKLTNRGFMRAPFIPIYGSGAMMLLISSGAVIKWPVLVFFAGLISCSVLEYATGALMEAVFKVRYWDYSDQPFNINGHICLGTSLCWGVLSLVLNYFLHKPVAALARLMPVKMLEIITLMLAVYFVVDLTLAFKAAFDLRALIIKLEEAKKEIAIMEKRLDVILAYANADFVEKRDELTEKINDTKDELTEKFNDTKDEISDKLEDFTSGIASRLDVMTDSVEAKLTELKKRMETMPQNFADNVREEFFELSAVFHAKFDFSGITAFFKDYHKRGLFLGNPSIKSIRFKDSVDMLKEFFGKKKD